MKQVGGVGDTYMYICSYRQKEIITISNRDIETGLEPLDVEQSAHDMTDYKNAYMRRDGMRGPSSITVILVLRKSAIIGIYRKHVFPCKVVEAAG